MEGLLPHLCDTVIGTRVVAYGEDRVPIDFTPPYRRVAYRDLVKGLLGDDWFEKPFDAQGFARGEVQGTLEVAALKGVT